MNEHAEDELFHKLSLHSSSVSQSTASEDVDDDDEDDSDSEEDEESEDDDESEEEEESEEDEDEDEELSSPQPGKCVTLYEEQVPEIQCAIVQGAGSATMHNAPSVEGMCRQ